MKLSSITKIKSAVASVAIIFAVLIFAAKTETSLAIAAKSIPVEPAALNAAEIYARSCARCHGNDGRGQTAKGKQTGATDFTSGKWQPNDARGIRVITNGKGKMPAFKGTLSADEIKEVLAYVKRFKG